MDGRSFDRLARLLSESGSRRQALWAVLATTVMWTATTAAEAKGRQKAGARNTSARTSRRQRRDRSGELRAEALPAICCRSGNCAPGPGKNLAKCCYEEQDLPGQIFTGANLGKANFRGATLTNANFAGANLGNACLVDADLTGATFDVPANRFRAIFCRTTMPDGSINNDGCDNGTECCPTCAGSDGAVCPPNPQTGEAGFCCAGGFCSCGGVCCAGPDCFVLTTQPREPEQPPRQQEFCERPPSCVMCGGREEQCCTACSPSDECISSGPISGGTIRRRR
jgi:hypothetical protein